MSQASLTGRVLRPTGWFVVSRVGEIYALRILENDGPLVRLGRVWVPTGISVELYDRKASPHIVLAEIELDNTRFRCARLVLTAVPGQRIGTLNSRVAVDRLVGDAVARVIYREYVVADAAALLNHLRAAIGPDAVSELSLGEHVMLPAWLHPDSSDSLIAAVEEADKAGSKRIARLARVADAYLHAGGGRAGNEAVALRMNLTPDTARQYVKDARRAGLIPPATRSQPNRPRRVASHISKGEDKQ